MGYKQDKYFDFYDDVRKRLEEICRQRTGRSMQVRRPENKPENKSEKRAVNEPEISEVPRHACCAPRNNNHFFTRNNNSKKATQESDINSFYKPVEETICLSQLLYGDFIDKKYKERYEMYYRQNGGYTREGMRYFINEVANDIFNVYKKPEIINEILDKIRTLGYGGLTSEEKQIIFSAKKK